MKQLNLPLGLFWALCLCVLSGCFLFEPRTIRLGEFSSLTGSESTFGRHTHQGIRMAVEEANAKGGLNGKKIELITRDTESNKEVTRTVVKRLIKDDHALVLIGEVASERSAVAATVAQINSTPMITPASTNPSITEVGDYIFRSCYIDPAQGYAMAKFARDHLHLKSVAVLKNNRSNYSGSLAEYFVETFQKLGGRIADEEVYSTGESDFSNVIAHIRNKKPEAVFIPGYYSEVAGIVQAMKKARFRPVLLGGDGWDSPELIKWAGSAVNGAYYSNHFSPDMKTPAAAQFVKSYREKYGEDPDGTASMGYDAARLALLAIENSHSLRKDKIRDALAAIHNYEGVTGKISYESGRNPQKSVVILKIEDGKPRYVKSITPDKEAFQ